MWCVLLTCEHAGNRIPARYRSLFAGVEEVLASHRGWDPGALLIARTMQRRLRVPLFYTTVSRLLVEANRSLHHPHLFSEFMRAVDREERKWIIEHYYRPHRERVTRWVEEQIKGRARVLHLSVHTFTPQLHGRVRRADIGLLYDPRCRGEKAFCRLWKQTLAQCRPDLIVRCNYPYLGRADGLTSALRKQFGERYAGIELEVNQGWLAADKSQWRGLTHDLAATFAAAFSRWPAGS
ncbi:MAG: hypothetical protein KatS3mg111_3690 [Pirellulaceae bacterium]|nr:MAG: hypothetical protein KatS3mg111_3690 [Pirellulaceae bacterium]